MMKKTGTGETCQLICVWWYESDDEVLGGTQPQ